MGLGVKKEYLLGEGIGWGGWKWALRGAGSPSDCLFSEASLFSPVLGAEFTIQFVSQKTELKLCNTAVVNEIQELQGELVQSPPATPGLCYNPVTFPHRP